MTYVAYKIFNGKVINFKSNVHTIKDEVLKYMKQPHNFVLVLLIQDAHHLFFCFFPDAQKRSWSSILVEFKRKDNLRGKTNSWIWKIIHYRKLWYKNNLTQSYFIPVRLHTTSCPINWASCINGLNVLNNFVYYFWHATFRKVFFFRFSRN